MYFNIPLDEVELSPVTDHNLRLFTIFNNAVLRSFNPKDFKYQTDSEESDEIVAQAEEALKQGYSL